jgi:hypothetical protein
VLHGSLRRAVLLGVAVSPRMRRQIPEGNIEELDYVRAIGKLVLP